MDGISTAKHIQARCDVPIVYLTAHSDQCTLERARTTGPYGYLTKPFQLQSLHTTIEMALHKHKLEQRLRESEARYRAVIDQTQAAIFLCDPRTGRILETNPAFHMLFGQNALDDPELSLYRIIIRNAVEIDAMLQQILAQRRVSFGEQIFRHKDGALRHADVAASLVAYGNQEVICMIAHDITKRKLALEARRKIERKLQEAQRLESLGVLAGGIAHDFNNILTSILGHAELMQMEVNPASDLHDSLHAVIIGARRAAELANQMLIYTGKSHVVIETIQLNTLVKEMADLLQVSISKHCTLQFNLSEQLPCVEGDPAQLRQVVMNLIFNAAEAIGDTAGTIALSTTFHTLDRETLDQLAPLAELQPGDYICLMVQDTGCGMDDTIIKRIFDPFFTTKFTGRGLGLAALQGIVRSHNGAIEVSSLPGLGSTFRVWLPATTNTVIAPANDQPAVLPQQPGTILVIDDETSVREITAQQLRRMGFDVRIAADGLSGLAMLQTGIPELTAILMDLTMPGLSSNALFAEIRTLAPAIPVVLMSGYSPAEAQQQCDALDIAGFLQKPFQLQTLRTVLASALAMQEQSQEQPISR
jgi:PAS domain S-box-containing protein